jgi:probable F420-dependent oxidoreductase
MDFILSYPEVTGRERDMLDGGHPGEIAACAEAAGFSGFALTEHPGPGANWLAHGGHQTLDPFVGLAFAAAATTRIRLLTYLTVAPYRNPFLLAKAATSLDRLSGGRLVLGMGTGYLKTEFFALGVDFAERNALFDEALDVLPAAWSGEPCTYQGLHFDARDIVQLPPPVQQPIPIWIGGNSQLTRRRVAERAQGWMPLSGPPELAQTTRTPHLDSLTALGDLIADVKSAAGPRGESLDFVVRYFGTDLDDPATDAGRHRDAFAAHAEIGVTALLVGESSRDAATHRSWIDRFGATYLS